MEESQEPNEIKPWQIEYKFVNDEFKKDYVLQRIAAAERAHFELMVDRLDENHSEYMDWLEAVNVIIDEINRLKTIYRQLGGSFGSEFING
tara:strand:+ start:24902 stop:25174 length:273 start_codon:yes stop_codon:yes gene_type:complete